MSQLPPSDEWPPPEHHHSEPVLLMPAGDDGSQEVRKVGYPFVAWAAILGTIALILSAQTLENEEQEGGDAIGLAVMRLQGQLIVGTAAIQQWAGGPETGITEIQQLNTGTVEQRLRYVTLVGELATAKSAISALDAVEKKIENKAVELSDANRRSADILRRLYQDQSAGHWEYPAVTSSDQQHLIDDMGWFGRLALAPEQSPYETERAEVLAPARRATLVLFGVAGIIGLLGLVGFVLIVVVVILLLMGNMRTRLSGDTGYGGVYAEAFALYMVGFILMGLLARFIVPDDVLTASLIAMCASLFTLAWPLIRGVPWPRMCSDLGLTRGRGWLVEAASGLVAYIMTIPVLFVGFILTLILAWLVQSVAGGGENFGPSGGAAHPIIQNFDQPELLPKLQVLVLAVIMAPLLEEIMFRGFLYRHLREWSSSLGTFGSVVVGILVSSFVFAVIHPQGIIAVPALMSLAIGFSLAREFRGSLISSMVAHGLNNGLITLVVLTSLG